MWHGFSDGASFQNQTARGLDLTARETERWMVVLAVTWMAKIGREADVTAIFEKLTAESRKEPGCLMYQVHKHKTDPRRFFIYAQYQDDAVLECHRTAPHFLQ